MKATLKEGVYLEVIFPSFAQINIFMRQRLNRIGFTKRGSEFSNVYVFSGLCYDESILQEVRMIISDYNSGKKEFTRELLVKQRVKHG